MAAEWRKFVQSHGDMIHVQWEFPKGLPEGWLDGTFPRRTVRDTPGMYDLPDGDTLMVIPNGIYGHLVEWYAKNYADR